MHFIYNDYELLYIYKYYNCEISYNILVNKYKPFIFKTIKRFYLDKRYISEFFQEGLVSLNKAIQSFSEIYNKTFLKYFELLLIREFINYKNNNVNIYYLIDEDNYEIKDNSKDLLKEEVIGYGIEENLSKLDREIDRIIYKEYFINNLSIKKISEKYHINIKKIYNTIYKLKVILGLKSIDKR